MKFNLASKNITSVLPREHTKDKTWLENVPKAGTATRTGKRFRRVSTMAWDAPVQAKGRLRWKTLKPWVYPISLAACLLTIGLLLLARFYRAKDRQETGSATLASAVVADSPGIAATGPARPAGNEVLSIVNHALAVRNPAEVAKFIDPGEASPEEIAGFMSKADERDGIVGKLTWLGQADANDLALESVAVYFGNDSRSKRIAYLTPSPDGTWKLDFESYAGRSKPSWEEIMGDHDAPAVVRVFVSSDTYYNGFFRSESEWICVGMASPDQDRLLFGYCRKGSRQAAGMERLLDEADGSTLRATLEIRRHEGPGSRQFEIISVLAKGWVPGALPYDQLEDHRQALHRPLSSQSARN